ncbi:hypothetical protein D3C75_420450 [compost metagenome]
MLLVQLHHLGLLLFFGIRTAVVFILLLKCVQLRLKDSHLILHDDLLLGLIHHKRHDRKSDNQGHQHNR